MKLIDLRSGGALLLLAVALSVVVVGWRVLPLLREQGHAVGDGRDPASYGFDLASATVPASEIVASGMSKDEMPALVDPAAMPVAGVAEFNAEHRGKYLVPGDRVVGVTVGGEARAYPVRLLNWHEVVNDTLGGVPIAVTYHPLCDSVVVFDRRVAGVTRTFGVSGLLLDSNLLMYDRRDEPSGESLWSQLLARAVAGPAAAEGLALTVLPASTASWAAWVERHPDTTVLRPDEARYKRYRRNPYGNYYITGKPRFPVDPLPPEDSWPWMTRVLVVEDEGGRQVLPLEPVVAPATEGVQVVETDEGPAALVDPRPGLVTYQALWFAWYAAHPGAGP